MQRKGGVCNQVDFLSQQLEKGSPLPSDDMKELE
jgi:hypothetical protein